MTPEERTPSIDELERMLAALPRELAFPPTPDIAGRIGGMLPVRLPAQLPARQPAPWRRRTTWYAIAAAVLLLIVVLTAALPGPRRAVADFFGLPGIRIEFSPRGEGDTGGPKEIGSTLLFGERTTLEGAQATVPFPIVVHGEPDEVYLRHDEGVTAVSLIYRASDELPEIGGTGVGMLLMEFRTGADTPFLAKRAMGDSVFLITSVNGNEAYWVERGELIVQPPDQIEPEASAFARRSGNVLIWRDGQTTYRMETTLDREEAIAIAESLAPWQSGNP
jgi:hypothetical protein